MIRLKKNLRFKACDKLQNQCSMLLFSKFFCLFVCQQECQVWVGHNFCPVWNIELDSWLNQILDLISQSTEFKLSKVFYCVCHIYVNLVFFVDHPVYNLYDLMQAAV